MSNLAGHKRLTAQAVRELATSCSSHPLVRGRSSAAMPAAVVIRDTPDVILLGHWADYGQSHHFMRRFDGQSPLEAYEESVQSIRSNTLSAAGKPGQRIRLYFRKDELPGVSRLDFLKTLRDGTGP